MLGTCRLMKWKVFCKSIKTKALSIKTKVLGLDPLKIKIRQVFIARRIFYC